MTLKTPDYKKYRQTQIENARVFQDFVADAMYSAGYPIVVYSSQLYQYKLGESRGGWEIKFDSVYETSGNLYIEIAEKAEPRPGPYAKSGIYRKPVFYVIGNYDVLFVFSTSLLLLLHGSGKYRSVENGTETSLGFLLPDRDANKYATLVLNPKLKSLVHQDQKELQLMAAELFRNLKPDIANTTLPMFPEIPDLSKEIREGRS